MPSHHSRSSSDSGMQNPPNQNPSSSLQVPGASSRHETAQDTANSSASSITLNTSNIQPPSSSGSSPTASPATASAVSPTVSNKSPTSAHSVRSFFRRLSPRGIHHHHRSKSQAKGRVQLSSDPSFLPLALPSIPHGKGLLEAAGSLVLQACKADPTTLPSTSPDINHRGSQWLNAQISPANCVTAVLRGALNAETRTLFAAEGSSRPQQVLLPLYVVGHGARSTASKVKKVEVVADVVEDEDANVLGGFDVILGMGALLSWGTIINLREGTLTLDDVVVKGVWGCVDG